MSDLSHVDARIDFVVTPSADRDVSLAGVGVQDVHPLTSCVVASKEGVGKAPSAVATHLSNGAVAVEELHTRVHVVDSVKQQEPVGADTRRTVAPPARCTRPIEGVSSVWSTRRARLTLAANIGEVKHEKVVAPGVELAHSHR